MNLKYIILDRDGVINKDSSEYIKNANEFDPLPRSLEAIKILSDNSFNIIIISNQSGIDRGFIKAYDFIQIKIIQIKIVKIIKNFTT